MHEHVRAWCACWYVGVGDGLAQHLVESTLEPDRPRSSSLIVIHSGPQNPSLDLSHVEGMDMHLVALVA